MQLANRYNILEKLGQGGMGVVYKAQDRLTNQLVAVKRVLLELPELDFSFRPSNRSGNLTIALAKEFQILASLRHPNIISVLDYGFSKDGQPFLVMEYIEAAKTILQAVGTSSLEQIVDLVLQLLQALSYLHRQRIIHRDLKGPNILVVDDYLRVVDFGLSKSLDDSQRQTSGTLHYMAPEFFNKQPASVQSDLYAVGVLLHEMITGHLPYNPDDITARLFGDLDLNKIISHPLETVIMRLLSTDPQDRYASSAETIESICHATDTAIPLETDAIRESYLQAATFVGRKQEIHHLEEALNNAMECRGSIVLVGGESGVGKSRLVDELRIRALVHGARVIRGQGVEGGGLPFQLWRDILPSLILTTELSNNEITVLKTLVPQIENLIRRKIQISQPSEDDAVNQHLLVSTIVEVLRRQKQALLIVLEDLQWTSESLEPVRRLIPYIESLPVIIIGTYRNDEKADLSEILLASDSIVLSRLDESSMTELSVSMLGKMGKDPVILNYLKQETDGNAFFMVEIIRALAEEAGRLANIGHMPLSEHKFTTGMSDILRRRVKRIEEQTLLKWAAIIGRQIDLRCLEHLILNTSGFRLETLNTFLISASDNNIFEVRENQWRFIHDKIRELILSDLTSDERPRLYRQVAESVEAIYGQDDAWATVLFDLWQQAMDKDKEMLYLPSVMFYTVRMLGNYKTGQRLGEYGLKYLNPNDGRRAALLNNMSMIMWRTGNYTQSWAYADEALTLAEAHHNVHEMAMALHNMATVAYYKGKHHDAIDYYQRSVELHQKGNKIASHGQSLLMLGWTQCMIEAYEAAIETINHGISLLASKNDTEGIALGQCTLGFALSGLRQYEDAIGYHQTSLEYYRMINSPWHIGLNLVSLGFIYLDYQGDACLAFFCEALRVSMGQESLLLEAVAGFAQYFLKKGQEQRAVQLVGAILSHPAMNGAVQMRLDAFQDNLKQNLGEIAYYAAIEIGEGLDISVVVQELLEELENLSS